jgi:hypothetical protein
VGIPERTKFREHLSEYRIVVYSGLECDNMFYGQVNASTRINLLCDDVNRHYHVITNLTGAMAQRYICNGCNNGCKQSVTHKCEDSCSDCMSVPPASPTLIDAFHFRTATNISVVERASIIINLLNQ